jgi:hypothetical protein
LHLAFCASAPNRPIEPESHWANQGFLRLSVIDPYIHPTETIFHPASKTAIVGKGLTGRPGK